MSSKNICALLSLLFFFPAFSQSGNTLPKAYAYSREVLGGAKRSVVAEENGGISTRASKPAVQYFIYIETATAADIQSVWVEGKNFSVTKEKIETPVIIQNATVPGKMNDTLLADTKNMVWQIQLKDKMKEGKRSAALNQLISNNAIVILYSRKGKVWKLPVKKIKKLSPVALS